MRYVNVYQIIRLNKLCIFNKRCKDSARFDNQFYFLFLKLLFFFKFVKLKASCITAVRLIQRTKQTVYIHVKLYMPSLSIHVLQMNLLTVCVLIIKTRFTDYNNRINKHQFPLSLKLKKQLNSLFMIKKN